MLNFVPNYNLPGRAVRLCLWMCVLLVPATGWAQPVGHSHGNLPSGPSNPLFNGWAAQGRIVPAGGVIHVAVPIGMQGAPIVSQILVKVGEAVKAGQVLAVLGNQPLLQAQLDNAELDKKTADALAAATAADVRSIGEIQTQLIDLEGRASIAEANVRHAAQSSSLALEQAKHDAAAATAAQEAAHQLAPLVQAVGAAAVAVAQAQVDAIPKGRSESKIALAQLDQAKASQQQATMDMTNKLAELQGQVDLADLHVRQAEGDLVHVPEPEDPTQFAPVQVEAHTAQAAVEAQLKFLAAAQAQHDADVLAAQARMASAEAAVIVAQTQLAMSEVRAPSAGTILALHAHPGEVAGPSGLLDLGDTADIFVDAVVDIHDAPGVKVGQKVSVKETAWSNDDVGGSVVEISPVVGGNSLPNPDPTAFSDTQVVVVKVHLDNPVPAANYINDQVYVVYSP